MTERELAFAPVVKPAVDHRQEDAREAAVSTDIPAAGSRMLGMLLNLVVSEMKANREFMAKALDLLANQPIPEIKVDLPKTEINLPDAVLTALERPITVTMPQPTPIEIEVEDE